MCASSAVKSPRPVFARYGGSSVSDGCTRRLSCAAVFFVEADDDFAGLLNRNSLKTGYGNRWTRERVTSLRSHHKIPVYSQQIRESEGWMTLTQAAATLAVSAKTLRLAAERGEVEAQHPLADGPWIFKRTALETDAARRLAQRTRNPPAGHESRQQSLNLSMT